MKKVNVSMEKVTSETLVTGEKACKVILFCAPVSRNEKKEVIHLLIKLRRNISSIIP